MNILLLATTDEQGAGIVARYTNDGFVKAGHNSLMLVKESGLKNNHVIALNKPVNTKSIKFRIVYKLKQVYNYFFPLKKDPRFYFYNVNERKTHISADQILKNVPFKPDAIFLLWVTDFVNTKTMNLLYKKTGAKIIWLMTDEAPLTGGCHYPWECVGFHTDCSNCPALPDPRQKHIAQQNLEFKKKNIPASLELVPGSEFDYQRALKASVFKGKKIHKLLAPIDDEIFNPADKAAAKAYFKIDAGQKVIFYGAQHFTNTRKGITYFIDALKLFTKKLKEDQLNQENYLLLLAGNGEVNFSEYTDIPIRHVGFLNEEGLVKAFQAADVFVSSSVQDSGPLMINQSIMCGTPVVAFEMGIAIDLVQTGKTGYLAGLCDAEDMAAGIKYVLSLPGGEFEKMCSNCRAFGLDNFTLRRYTEKLLNLVQAS